MTVADWAMAVPSSASARRKATASRAERLHLPEQALLTARTHLFKPAPHTSEEIIVTPLFATPAVRVSVVTASEAAVGRGARFISSPCPPGKRSTDALCRRLR